MILTIVMSSVIEHKGNSEVSNGDISLWIDEKQVKDLSGFPMRIYAIVDGAVLPYVLDPNFEKYLPIIPSEVASVNFTWKSGESKRYNYNFDQLMSYNEDILANPLISIDTKGEVPKKPRTFEVFLPCVGNVSGIASLAIGLAIFNDGRKNLPGTPLRLKLQKQCAHHAPDPECDQRCANGGWCNKNKICECPKGYIGKYCQSALCYPVCMNGGVCMSPGVCTCTDNFQGPHCEGGICREKCLNGGKCVQKDTCKCRRGYYGRRCEFSKCRNEKSKKEHLSSGTKISSDEHLRKSHGLKLPRRNLSAVDPENIKSLKIDSHTLESSDAQNGLETDNSNLLNKNAFYTKNDAEFERIEQQQKEGEKMNFVVNEKRNDNEKYYIPSLRMVHLDLKGAPPKISYLKQIFPLLKEAGANGILLEYEDMFPFWGYLKPIAAGNAYTNDDIKAILDLAKIHNFEVIPLVQTFGHLEMALKLKEFRHLREVDNFPMALCPSKNESFTLVTNIIDQIMMMHSTSKYLHIGCDEVFHMGYCEKCRHLDRDNIYLNHVTRVAKYVCDKYNVRPIIWDDMLRNIPSERLKESNLGSLVEPMLWTYVRDIYRFIPYPTWMTFAEIFPNIWAASAFKGAFGETLTVPNVKMHLENNEAWLEVMKEQYKNFKALRGIVVTGWQRYDHLATLCELLPAGLPSLVVNLLTLSHGRYNSTYVFKMFDRLMRCPSNTHYYSSNQLEVDFENDPNLWQRAANCLFPGSSVFQLTMDVVEAVKRFNEYSYSVTIHKAWMTDYNVRRNFSNPFRIDEGLQDHSSVYYRLTSLVKQAQDALKSVFDDYTVAEWIEQNIYPYIVKMETIMKNGVELKKVKNWDRRPLKPLSDLQRFGVGNVLYLLVDNRVLVQRFKAI
ncbi:hypothetical protein B4U80_05337 [Leptotrombidium deliense]|uniref:Wnt inhibitory factor 1 n=1 Tax=Leptotrombidium deliense TaxID=299467 RepID=A0A443SHU7_9ACAR|nr:hypothetical protein B4U80_05337 [Leptotrombidium deliense]